MRRQTVFFLIDTQGANCVGAYAEFPSLATPHIDRLCETGVRFDRAYTCSPVCGPARSALFTGLFPHSNGVLANDLAPHLDIPTLGQRLQKTGIRAAYIGKWHLDGTDYFGNGRCPDGWDPGYWMDGRNYLDSLPSDEARALSRKVLNAGEVERHSITSEFTHAHRIADRARSFLERYADEDFLLVVSIDEPHHPFICPEPFVSAFQDFAFPVPNFADSLEGKPRGQREWAEQANLHLESSPSGGHLYRSPSYFGCNSFSDHQVGRVIEAIDRFAPEAMVIYTADHGDMFGSHRLMGKGPAVYEEMARVPLVIRSPMAAPRRVAGPVSHIDVAPTILDYFGQPIPPLLQGGSLLSVVRGDALPSREVFIEFNRFEVDHDGFGAFSPIRGIVEGRYKLAVNLLDRDELYDLASDPLELDNRIMDPGLGDVRARLHDRLLAWMNVTRDPLRGPVWGRRAWREMSASSWRGPTRPRPFDPLFEPKTLLYDTGRVVDRLDYPKQ
jgi:uncharacterized sulfatase